MKVFGTLVFLIFALFPVISLGHEGRGKPKQILVLHTGNSEFYWSRDQMRGIRKRLSEAPNGTYYASAEFLDLVENRDESFLKALQNLILKKYTSPNRVIDGILICDDPAMEFFIHHLDKHFPDIPVVAAGLNIDVPERLKSSGRVFSALLELPAFKETLDLAFQLHAGIKRVVVISETRPDYKRQADAMRGLSKNYSAEFIFRGDETFEELASFLRTLGEGDVVFRLGYYRDRLGRVLDFDKSMHLIHSNANVPIYSFWEGTIGHGVIGGKMLSGVAHGYEAADHLLALLKGAHPSSKESVAAGSTEYMFDYKQLVRFGIPLSSLPPGSKIVGRTYTFLERHRTLTISVSVAFAALVVFSSILISFNIKLRATRRELVIAKDKAEEASVMKSRFLANMSHEIRTPLGAILGFSDLISAPDLGFDQKADFSSKIRSNGKVLSTLVDDILDLSRIEAGQFQLENVQTTLVDILRDVVAVVQLRADEKALRFELHSQGPIPASFTTDPLRLRQILINVIGNAIKFTDHGEVSVSIRHSDTHRSSLFSDLVFDVVDTGRGLTQDQAQRLFEPFQQGDASMTRIYGGTGLGLNLSRSLARLMDGDVALVSFAPGKGCHFQVSVKVKGALGSLEVRGLADLTPRGPLSDLPHPSDSNPRTIAGAKVLLAEDSPDNQLLIQRYLKSSGVEVDVATNGEQAVEMALGKEYDVVLMDVQMPILDGLSATRRLRTLGYDRPILALTAHALLDQRERSLSAGCDAHLTKPIYRTVLIEAIALHVGPRAEKNRNHLDDAEPVGETASNDQIFFSK